MTNDEYEASLKQSVRVYEALYNDYNKMMGQLHKEKEIFPPENEFTVWYKAELREQKNECEKQMKHKREELTYYRQGLNPPYCYPY